jgi:hypothetical protein
MSSTLCPHCDSLKQNVEFKTCLPWVEGVDTYVCEDCFNKIEEEEEDEEEEEEEEEEEDSEEED